MLPRIRKHITGSLKDQERAEEQRAKRRREAIEYASAAIEHHISKQPKVINEVGDE